MKKFISTIYLTFVSVLIFSLVQIEGALATAPASVVQTEFGPIYYLGDADASLDGETVDYQKTECKVGMQFFISEKGVQYETFVNDHFSNPDSSSNLLDKAVAKFNSYRDMLNEEFFKYRARAGQTTASQFELLEKCYIFVKNEIEDRQKNLKENFRAGAADRKAVRLSAKYQTINDRFKEKIHFPYAQFLGRMKSFSDGMPCYTNKCAK